MISIFNWFINHRKLAALCAYIWAAIIFAACLIPGRDVPSLSIFQYDKLLHFAIFALLAFLILLQMKRRRPRLLKEGLYTLLAGIAYGYFVEIMQGSGITEGRAFDHYDAMADGIGALLGVLIFFICQHCQDKKFGSPASRV